MSKETNLDDFLTKFLLIENLEKAQEATTDINSFMKNILEVAALAPGQAFLKTNLQELPNKKVVSLNILLPEIPDELPVLKKQISELMQLGDMKYEAKRAMEEINMMAKESKARYKIPVSGTTIPLTELTITNIDNLNNNGITVEFSTGGMSTEEGIETMNNVFRGVLGYNVLYVLIINFLKQLEMGLVELESQIQSATDETQRATIVDTFLNGFSADKARQEGNDLESQLQLSLKNIAESFLVTGGQSISEDFLRFYEPYKESIPDFTRATDISDKYFIESLTRVYKTLVESMDIELQNKSNKINTNVKKKAAKLNIPKESKSQVINEFLQKDIEEKKDEYVRIISDIIKELRQNINNALQAPTSDTDSVQPGQETFNFATIKDLVQNKLTDYQNYYDRFIKKIQKAT